MKILVTGSKGYIGSLLCMALRSIGVKVVEFDIINGDNICDIDAVNKASKGVDSIIHLAAIVGYPAVEKDPDLAYRVNVLGTQNIVNTGNRIVFASALSNYEVSGTVDEDTEINAITNYAKQKLEAEKAVLAGRGNVVTRFGSLYGCSPNMRWDLLMHTLIKNAVKTGNIDVYQPDFIRAFSNIEDVILALTMFAFKDEQHGVFNVVSINMSKRELAEIIKAETMCNVNIVDGWDEESRNYTVSSEKIKKLGFKFNPRLRESVFEISQFARR